MKLLYTLLLALSYTILFAAPQDPSVLRGPYLQVGTETSVIIRWRSVGPSTGSVKYGTQLGQQTNTATESVSTAEHEVKITGLQPFTQYFYSIYDGANVVAGGDTTYNFITNPVAGTVQPLHFWVTGDMGNGSPSQADVRDAYWNNVRAGRHCDGWIWLGDNVYSTGKDIEYQTKLFDVYPQVLRSVVSRPCPGNHDYGEIDFLTHDGPYYQNFTMPKNGEAGGKPSAQEGYYSYDCGNVHFVSLNSEVLLWYISQNSDMCNWLKQDLAATTQPWKIVYWHKPPYTKGSHDSDSDTNLSFMRTVVAPILEQYGVDLVLCGHSHNYERSFPINGHFGSSGDYDFTMQVSNKSGKESEGQAYTRYLDGPDKNKGTIYIVCGNGGQKTSGKSLDHPIMYFSQQDSAGFMTIDVNGMRLDANYYDSHGNKWDNFIINKVNAPTGVKESNAELKGLNFYPNPFKQILHAEIELATAQQVQIELIDITGKTVQQLGNRQLTAGKNLLEIPTTEVPSGNYYIRLSGDKLGEVRVVTSLNPGEE